MLFSRKDQNADYFAKLLPSPDGLPVFEIYERGECVGECRLQVPGRHNVMNALAACAAARIVGISWEVILHALSLFGGAKRRFERKGEFRGVTVVDDYAHHPSEIAATLRAAKERPFSRVVCLFQPHTYSRTKALWQEFVKALSAADLTILLDIYAAREAPDPLVTSQALARDIPGALYADSFEPVSYTHLSSVPSSMMVTSAAVSTSKTLSKPRRLRAAIILPSTLVPIGMPKHSPS